ncbi:MAG: alpha-amylase family glycosyl hydrolase [Candidatus Promineifilaceae bacterium]|nr:alpha-amylase family glycosyl hydrolase [Candidatus Promineifilaceae bacterium]
MSRKTNTPSWQEIIYRLLRQVRQVFHPVQPSTRRGMGAIPYDGGVAFRVWAPGAQNVFVSGSFNNWSKERHPLAREEDGYWSADVNGAIVGDEYRYFIHNGTQRLMRTDPYARDVSPENANSVVCESWGQFQEKAPPWMPPWNELIIYELHVGTFEESAARARGQFQGVIDKLPYLRYLGVNAIEIMPVAEFAGDYSWGYNPAHPFAITRSYGGREAFRELVTAAHNMGIAVIVDVVYNHFGPQDLSLWQFDGWQENGKGGVYFYNDWRSTTPWADTRPDYGRRQVRQFIRDNALMWLEEFQVDGLRWDATAWIRNVHGHEDDPAADIQEGWDMMRWINDEIDGRQSWSLIIAEDLRRNELLTRPTGEGGAGFDSQWDDQFVHALRQAIITADDVDRDLEAVAQAVVARYNGDVFKRVIYTESHDEVANGKARVPEDIAPGAADSLYAKKRSVLGAALVFSAPGIPMIFQGQEFLESGWFDDHVPLDWQKARIHGGMVKLYRDLIHLRRNCDGQTRGLTGQKVEIVHLDNERKTLAFRRWEFGGPGDDVVIVANFAHTEQEINVPFPAEGLWRLRFNSDQAVYDPAFGDSSAADVVSGAVGVAVSVAPYAVHVYSQDAGRGK